MLGLFPEENHTHHTISVPLGQVQLKGSILSPQGVATVPFSG